MNWANGVGLGRSNSSVRKVADCFLSLAATIVWLKVMVMKTPNVLRRLHA